MINRVQLSLRIDDSTLYEGLVLPWKSNKELQPLVVRLLSAYFYSEDIRNSVDMFGEEDFYVEEGSSSSFEDAINNARDTLAFMNILTEGAQNILSDGIDDINRIASDTGGSPVRENTFGKSVPSFKRVDGAEGVSSPEGLTPVQENREKILRLEDKISGMSEDLASLKNMLTMFMQSGVKINETPSTTSIENSLNDFANEITSEDVTKNTEAESNMVDTKEETVGVVKQEAVMDIIDDTPPAPPTPPVTSVKQNVTVAVEEVAQQVIEPTSVVQPEPSVAPVVVPEPISEPVVKPVVEPVPEPISEPVVKSEPEMQLDGSASLASFLDSGIAFSVSI